MLKDIAAELNITESDAVEVVPLLSRLGAPFDYNMKCYSKTSMPSKSSSDFLLRGNEDVDCVGDTLWWMHSVPRMHLKRWSRYLLLMRVYVCVAIC